MPGSTPALNRSFRYGYAETDLGLVLVAEGDGGIAAILLGDDRATLLRDLRATLSGAALTFDENALAATLAKIVALIAAPHTATDLSLDLQGSALEIAVWRVLQTIPPGETRTYGQIAKALTMPVTTQEVGAACAANRIAVAIPCHRVVKADGSISGYRWGVHRKRRLINLEGVA
jgi:AraC family transcriptional regulator of adaptative response/methylated-DNA-[protein]-cysteine methyltransferase